MAAKTIYCRRILLRCVPTAHLVRMVAMHSATGGTPGQSFVTTMFGLNNETLNAHTMIWAAALSTYLYWLARCVATTVISTCDHTAPL